MGVGGYDTLKTCDEIHDKSWLDGVKVTVQYLDRSWKKKRKKQRKAFNTQEALRWARDLIH